jgi:hypothetical protein
MVHHDSKAGSSQPTRPSRNHAARTRTCACARAPCTARGARWPSTCSPPGSWGLACSSGTWPSAGTLCGPSSGTACGPAAQHACGVFDTMTTTRGQHRSRPVHQVHAAARWRSPGVAHTNVCYKMCAQAQRPHRSRVEHAALVRQALLVHVLEHLGGRGGSTATGARTHTCTWCQRRCRTPATGAEQQAARRQHPWTPTSRGSPPSQPCP